MAGIADAVAREAEWFVGDHVADGLPALLAATGNDGPFGVVGAYPRRLSQRAHQCYVWREALTDTRRGAGLHELRHFLVATVLWSQAASPERAHNDQAALDAALERIFTRIVGAGNRSHGGRFTSVAAATSGPGVGMRMTDPFAALVVRDAPGGLGLAYRVDVRYVATETITVS